MGLPEAPIRWPAEAIWEEVAPVLPGFTVEVLPEIDSTNTELMRRCRAGLLDPTLLVAERQTAGRGRLGRQWHTPPGSSLTFSLGLPLQPADWSGLSLAVGTSLAECLAGMSGGDVRLKWPNDLWLGQAKLAGILVETASAGAARYVIVGVGINIREPAPHWAPPPSPGQVMAAQAPAWLQADAPLLEAPAVLQALVGPLVRDVLSFQQQGFAAFGQRFARRDLLAGREVQLSDGRHGRACGVSPLGALLVDTGHGVEEVISADVSVRPR